MTFRGGFVNYLLRASLSALSLDNVERKRIQLEDAIPTNEIQPAVEQDALEKSNVQKRIDELTAEKYAMAEQVKALSSTVQELTKKALAPAEVKQTDPTIDIPEGMDPGVAKFLQAQIDRVSKDAQMRTEQLYWQMQHQIDQTQVSAKYGHLPSEVVTDAAKRLTGLKQQYGNGATMEDAIKFAHYDYLMKQSRSGNAAAFNQLSQPMGMQSSMPNVGGAAQQSTTLAPPTQRSDWDRLDLHTQNRLIDEYEKKGGRLNIL